jgi:hypothetical protein
MNANTLQTSRTIALLDGSEISLENGLTVRMALQAVSSTDWEDCYFRRDECDSTPEPVLRTLIVYCLGTGRFSAEEIESAREEDAGAGYICGRSRPKAGTIHDFRRRHSAKIRKALSEFLRYALSMAETSARQRSIRADQDFTWEAAERVRRAIAADTLAADI